MKKFLSKYIVYLAWIQSVFATTGSLYFSEIAGFTPCTLCWYQRILMYPLIAILTVGIIRKDTKNLPYYVLPLSLLGSALAFYHWLLQLGVVRETTLPCRIGLSCSNIFVEYLGFITIPFLSLVAFTVISICIFIYWRLNK